MQPSNHTPAMPDYSEAVIAIYERNQGLVNMLVSLEKDLDDPKVDSGFKVLIQLNLEKLKPRVFARIAANESAIRLLQSQPKGE